MNTDLDRRQAMLSAIDGIMGHLGALREALTKPSEPQRAQPHQAIAMPPLATVTPIMPAEEPQQLQQPIATIATDYHITPTEEPVMVAPETSAQMTFMTFDDFKAQLQHIAANLTPPEQGQEQLRAILAQFGVDRISLLKPEQYGEMLIAANALLAKQVGS